MTGIELIAQERAEHTSKHARTILDDVKYNDENQLGLAAEGILNPYDEIRFALFPRGWSQKDWNKMAGKTYRERLIIAGSFIAAELDRLTELDRRKTEEFEDE